MSYTSYVSGVIEPAGTLDGLLEFLDDWYIVTEYGWLESSTSGWSTGFRTDDGKLVSIEGSVATYAFDETFIKVLMEASKERLISYAHLYREGQDHDDEEVYEYVNGVWYTWIRLDFKVPLGEEDRLRKTIHQVALEVIKETE